MPAIEFAGVSNRDSDNRGVDTQRLINCYVEPAGNRSRVVYKSVLGEDDGVSTDTGIVRAFQAVKDRFYVAAGDTLHQLKAGGSLVTRGTFTETAQVSMAALNGAVCLASGGRMYYAYAGQSLQEIDTTSSRFDAIAGIAATNNYLIAWKTDSAEWMWSDLRDPETFPGLNFAEADARDDNIQRIVPINGNLWIFKERSIEIWAPTGQADQNAFSRLGGAVIDTGLASFGLVTNFDGGALFVGDDGIVYQTNGASIQPVSKPSTETAIAKGDPDSCFYYEDEGHKIACIRFTDRPAWCFDLSTQLWHERASGVKHRAWETTATGTAFGRWYNGAITGDVYKMTRNNTDARHPLKRTMVSSTIMQEGRRFRVVEAKIYALAVDNLDVGRGDPVGTQFSNQIAIDEPSVGYDTAYTAADSGTNWLNRTIGTNTAAHKWRLTDRTVGSYTFSKGPYDYWIDCPGGLSTGRFSTYRDLWTNILPAGVDPDGVEIRVTCELARSSTSVSGGVDIAGGQSVAAIPVPPGGVSLTGTEQDWTEKDSGWVTPNAGSTVLFVGFSALGGTIGVRNLKLYVRGNLPVGSSVTTTASGYPPAFVDFRVSRDFGHTWGDVMRRDSGDVGEYNNQMVLRNLGQARQFTLEASITDNFEVPLYGTGYLRLA